MCIVVGGISLNEFEKYDSGQMITFSCGCGVCVIGMMILLHFDSMMTEENDPHKEYYELEEVITPKEVEPPVSPIQEFIFMTPEPKQFNKK